jgi:hypothetical protein
LLRAEEFNGSGVPYRFVVEYDALVNGPRDVEQKAHSLLRAYHENKEWFKCDITTAITAIRQAANGSVITETTKILTLLPSLSSQPKKNKFIVQDGIATDTDTGLIWLRFAYGQIWLDDTSVGKVKEVCWEDAFDCAKQFNQQGGYADYASWRLPTVSELKSLIDEAKNNYINADIFPNNTGSFFGLQLLVMLGCFYLIIANLEVFLIVAAVLLGLSKNASFPPILSTGNIKICHTIETNYQKR